MTFGHLEDFALGIADQLRHVGRFVYERRWISVAERISSRCTYFWAMILAWNSTLAAEPTFCVSCQVRRTAHLLQLLADLQPLGDRIEVDRFELGRELLDLAR